MKQYIFKYNKWIMCNDYLKNVEYEWKFSIIVYKHLFNRGKRVWHFYIKNLKNIFEFVSIIGGWWSHNFYDIFEELHYSYLRSQPYCKVRAKRIVHHAEFCWLVISTVLPKYRRLQKNSVTLRIRKTMFSFFVYSFVWLWICCVFGCNISHVVNVWKTLKVG